MEVAIVGGGASGIMCAVAIMKGQGNVKVTVFEKLPKVLKKILVTGNGRCNLTNLNADVDCYRGNTDIVINALRIFPPESNLEFFRDIGLMTRVEDEGRVYPMSSQAGSVVNALRLEAERLGVKVVTDTEIVKIENRNGRFILNSLFEADSLVMAAGGSASKPQGTDGGSYRLLKQLGVNIITPKPALVALNARNFTKSLKGIRNICFVRLFIDNKEIYSEKGEVQFTDYGLSGIPIMQLSGLVSCSDSDNITVVVDCLPEMEENDIFDFIMKRVLKNPSETAENAVCGILPKALGNHLMLLCAVKKDGPVTQFDKRKAQLFANTVKFWEIPVESTRGFDFAQVTAGGADCNEFSLTTLEHKRIKHLYCTGEALDVYGLCGGYNLQWAWSSARLVALSIAKENGIVKNK